MTNHSPAPSRTFTSPSGRRWTVALAVAPAVSGADLAVVLRFTSGDLVLDVGDWPADWETLSDDALVELARKGQPPRLGGPREPVRTQTKADA